MHILILGGTRFLGRHLVEAALARGHELTVYLDRMDTNEPVEGATIETDYRGLAFDRGVYLVGDAAGLASGLTGEGIYSALVSGEEVAQLILQPGYRTVKTLAWLRIKRLHEALARLWQKRAARNPWVAVGVTAGAVVAVIAVVAALYFFGFGWPTQAGTVNALLGAHAKGEQVSSYWVAVPSKDVSKDMAKIPPVDAFKLESVTRGSTSSVVVVTVTPKKGSPLRYKITLQRQGVGWFVSGVDNDWQSTGN